MDGMERASMSGPIAKEHAIQVLVQFYFSRPASTKKSVAHKTTKPDLDKLVRSIFDAMTGIVFVDDSQVCKLGCTKGFDTGGGERAEVTVKLLTV